MSDIQSHHFSKGVWMLLALLFYFLSSPADIPDSIKTKIQLGEQLTDVPTIYITIPSVSDISKMSKWVDGIKDNGEAGYWTAEIKVVDASKSIDVFTDSVQIKVRGNSTANADKKPYRLKFAKKHKHDLMGSGFAKRNWVLLANALQLPPSQCHHLSSGPLCRHGLQPRLQIRGPRTQRRIPRLLSGQ